MQWSLEDIYKKQVSGKIPQRKHLSVLGEALVTIEFGDKDEKRDIPAGHSGHKKIVDDIPDIEARKLLKLSDQESRGEIPKWIESAGWDSEDAQFLLSQKLNTIYTNTEQLTNQGTRREFYKQIARLTELKNRGRINILREALDKGKVDIYAYINTKFRDQFPLLVNERSLEQIGQIGFAEGAVGVGPGEALLTLFTEGVNPEQGDIVLPNNDEVELKAGEGRPGKTRVAKLVRNFEEFSAGEYKEEEIPPELVKNAERALQVIEKRGTDLLKDEAYVKAHGAINEVLEIIRSNKYKTVEQKVAKLSPSESGPADNRYKGPLYQAYWLDPTNTGVQARDHISELRKLVKHNAVKNTIRTKDFFRQAGEDDPPYERLVGGLSKFSHRGEEEEIKGIIRDAIDFGKRVTPNIEEVALAIAMAFQITEYYDELPHKFTYYTLFDKYNGNLVTWGPFEDDYVTNLTKTLRNIFQSLHLLDISGDSGGRTGYNLGWKGKKKK